MTLEDQIKKAVDKGYEERKDLKALKATIVRLQNEQQEAQNQIDKIVGGCKSWNFENPEDPQGITHKFVMEYAYEMGYETRPENKREE